MPFTFKLSKRLALMKSAQTLALLGALVACELPSAVEPAGTSVAQLAVVPDTVTLDPSQTQQFHAYGRTQAGDSVGILTTWSATGGGIAFSGLYTAAPQEGDYQVTAWVPPSPGQPPRNASATVRVRRRGLLVRAVVLPATPTVVTGGTQQFAAYGLLDNGDSVAVSVTWSASSGTISPSGLYTAAQAPGGDIVIARASGTTGTALIAVSNVAVASVSVSPASAGVSAGSTRQLGAVVKDANGNVLIGRTVTWTTSDNAVATVSSSGLVTGVAAGTATITATSEGKSGTAAISVANVPVASVVISPGTAVVIEGATEQLAATLLDSAGNVLSDRPITWASSDPTVATVSSTGLVTGVAAGAVTITATSEGKTGSAAVKVNGVPVASVSVSPTSATVSVGATQQFSAVVKGVNDKVLNGRTVTWATSSSAVATVSSSGLVTAVATGTATITATSEGKSGSASLTVTDLPVASVTISPTAPSAYVGGSVQLTATPKDANGNPLSGRTVTWTTGNGAVATVSASGLVTALAVGSATITATSEGQSGAVAVTVSNIPVASVVVSPTSANALVGSTVQLNATAKDSAGNVLAGRAVTWTSSNPAIATVSPAGLVTGVAAGSATITATSEGKSASATISVANVPVASVVINPVTAVVLVGATVQLAATPLDSAGNVLSGRSVTWASSASAVATVSSTGLVTGIAAAAVTITATSEGRTSSAAVTVNPVPVASVSVSPASAAIIVGQTVQLTATPKDANGNVLTGRAVTWASSAPGVATVSSGGLVTAVAAGAATITATSEGKSASAVISVANASVASVVISPVTAVVLEGATVQLAATLLDSAGNVLSGRPVTWASSAPAVATVSSTGLVTGVAAGAVTITAMSEGKTGSAAVTVNPVPVASVTISPASASVSVGSTKQLSAVVKDATGNVLTGRTVAWVSSAPAVAVVSSGGLVTGSAPGSATITATSEGKSGTAAITVTSAGAGKHYYVSPSGSDANSCSSSSPCFTMQRASQLLSPGDIAHFASGNYPWGTQKISKSGTASARVTYISDVKWGAKIIGTSCNEMIRNTGDYVDIIDFDITGPCNSGLLQDGNYGRIIGNRVHDLPGTNGYAGILVDCCRYTLTGNEVIGNVVDNIGPLGGTNTIHGIYVAGPNSVIANNIVTRASAACIHLYHGSTREIVSNNVVANCGRYGILVSAEGAITTNDYTTVNNNIVVNVAGRGIDEYPAVGSNNVYNNNIVYNNSPNFDLIGGTQSGTIILTSSQFSSLFVNYTGDMRGDYHLRSGAVAIDAGTTRCAAGVSNCVPLTDFDGVTRPKGAAYDIGAYEYTP